MSTVDIILSIFFWYAISWLFLFAMYNISPLDQLEERGICGEDYHKGVILSRAIDANGIYACWIPILSSVYF